MEIRKPFTRTQKLTGVLINETLFLKNPKTGEVMPFPKDTGKLLTEAFRRPLLDGAFCELYNDLIFLYGVMEFSGTVFNWLYVYRKPGPVPVETYTFPKEDSKTENLIEGKLWEEHGYTHEKMSLRPFAKADL